MGFEFRLLGGAERCRAVQGGAGQGNGVRAINRTVHDGGDQCTAVQNGGGQCRVAEGGAGQCRAVQSCAGRCRVVQGDAGWCRTVQSVAGPVSHVLSMTCKQGAAICIGLGNNYTHFYGVWYGLLYFCMT